MSKKPTDKYKKTSMSGEDDDGRTGDGGQSGDVEFRDFLSSGETLRDDMLPPDEVKRLLSVHKEGNEARVKKGKETNDKRQQLREGKINAQEYREGKGHGMESQYKAHPALADKAQFHDPQVTLDPNEQVNEANPELQNELRHEYRLKHEPQHQPDFNPRLTR